MKHYDLVGIDGNAFSVMGYVLRAMKYCKLPKSEQDDYTTKAISGDYSNLLAISSNIIDRCNAIQSTDFDQLESDIQDWFWHSCNKEAYVSISSWRESMVAASDYENSLMVEEAIVHLCDKYDECVLNNMRSRIEDILSNLAQQALNDGGVAWKYTK